MIGHCVARIISSVGLLAVMTVGVAGVAQANQPQGACCSADMSCEEVSETVCASTGRSYIGDDTSCANIQCAPVMTPVMSILGVVATVGALGGWGVFRLFRRRRLSTSR